MVWSVRRQHYSAERMSLVVLGGQDLDALAGAVQRLFSAVQAGRGPRPEFSSAGRPFKVRSSLPCSSDLLSIVAIRCFCALLAGKHVSDLWHGWRPTPASPEMWLELAARRAHATSVVLKSPTSNL